MATVAELETRRDEILAKIKSLEDLVDGSEDGTTIHVSKRIDSFIAELKIVETQIQRINRSTKSIIWLGTADTADDE